MGFTLAEAVIKVFIPRDEVRGQLGGVEEEALRTSQRVEQTLTRGFSPKRVFSAFTANARDVRRSLIEVGSALSGTAAIASLLVGENQKLKENLQATSLALIGASTAARALGSILRLLLLHPFLLIITAIAALIFAGDDLKRGWEDLKVAVAKVWVEIGAVVSEVIGGLIDVGKGFLIFWGSVLTLQPKRAEQALDLLQQGLDRLKVSMPEVTAAAQVLGNRALKWLRDLFGQTGKAADDALAKALHFHDVNSELNRLGLEEQIADLERIRDTMTRTAEQRLDIELRIFRLREQAHKEAIERFVALELGAAIQIGHALEGAASEGARALARLPEAVRMRVDPAGAAAAKKQVEDILAAEKARLEANVRVVDLQREMGQATREEAIAARQVLLTDQTLKLTAEERLQLEKEIGDLRAAADPMAGLTAAIRENLEVATDWKETWTTAIQGMQSAIGGAFKSIRDGSKNVLEAARDAVVGILDAVLDQLDKLAANWILQQILGGALGLAGGGVAKGKLIPVAAGALFKGLAVRAQRGLMAKGPTLAALAETPGLNELVMPLPKGLRPEDLAKMMQRTGEGPSVQEGDVHITYTGDMSFASPQDIRSHARIVGDAVRQARRMNHPVIRGGEA